VGWSNSGGAIAVARRLHDGGGGSFSAKAFTRYFENDRVMDEAVDGGSGGHWVLENTVPLAKYQVAAD
jgi:hypothetical protein